MCRRAKAQRLHKIRVGIREDRGGMRELRRHIACSTVFHMRQWHPYILWRFLLTPQVGRATICANVVLRLERRLVCGFAAA